MDQHKKKKPVDQSRNADGTLRDGYNADGSRTDGRTDTDEADDRTQGKGVSKPTNTGNTTPPKQ